MEADELAPSERTPDRLVLAKLDELSAAIEAIPRAVVYSSWWDQLDAELAGPLTARAPMVSSHELIRTQSTAWGARCETTQNPDSIDIRLIGWDGMLIWQRRLYVGRPPSVS